MQLQPFGVQPDKWWLMMSIIQIPNGTKHGVAKILAIHHSYAINSHNQPGNWSSAQNSSKQPTRSKGKPAVSLQASERARY